MAIIEPYCSHFYLKENGGLNGGLKTLLEVINNNPGTIYLIDFGLTYLLSLQFQI
jgi:hypothetical protein